MAGRATGAGDSVKVVARFRPLNPLESTQIGGGTCVTFPHENKVEIKTRDDKEPHKFEFDRVYLADVKQSDVFEFTGQQIVEDVFKGYNGTIFVYGQTGSGKTYSMMGPNLAGLQGYCDDPDMKGIIPRVVEAIFNGVEEADENIEFTLKVSYVEIYMERIRDLLDTTKTNLHLHEDFRSGRGVYVADATEAYVSDPDEVFRLMQTGASNRTVASTRMNDESSRSHSIFLITVTQKHSVKMEQKSGKLCLVDLAGSERAGKTKAEGQQLEEAKLINKSLTTLGMVINALTDKRSTHVPYRDSKLTRLLQDSVGGNSRTTLIICCSPSKYNDHETLSTLRFGERAKTIQNKAKINREWTVAELKVLLGKAEREITQLKKLKGVASPEEDAKRAQELLDLENEWQEEKSRLIEEREDLLQQIGDVKEQLDKMKDITQRMGIENKCLRQLDESWEQEYNVLERRLNDTLFCYEKEKQANAEKIEAIENVLRHAEDMASFMHMTKGQSQKFRQQVEQHLLQPSLADGWSANGKAGLHPPADPPANGAPAEDTQQATIDELQEEVRQLRTENEFLRSAAVQEQAERQAEGAEDEEAAAKAAVDQEKLLKDLQAKHDRVIDLEIGLDEARESYNKLLYTSSNKVLKKRVIQLEQQAEQQAEHFQEVYNDNSTLRLEIQLAEKKLAIRNERIENLKAGLKEEKRHLKELQEQFAAEREKFKTELSRSKDELNYWKEKSLVSRERNNIMSRKSKNVVKVLKGGQKQGSFNLDALRPESGAPEVASP